MNSLINIKIKVIFPFGATFRLNPCLYASKRFYKMVQDLCCLQARPNCEDCIFSEKCHYYHMTGENFKKYPGVIFRYNIFEKNILREKESILYDIYLIGKCEEYRDYIPIFFQEYLNYKIGGNFYQILDISNEQVLESIIHSTKIKVASIVESLDFSRVYNDMINYYNHHYNANYQPIKMQNSVRNIVKINHPSVSFSGIKHFSNGYIYEVDLDDTILGHFLKIGIGKYNFIGGGNIEINNKFEC